MIIFISVVVGTLAVAIATIAVLVGTHLPHHESLTLVEVMVVNRFDANLTVQCPQAATLPRPTLVEHVNRRNNERAIGTLGIRGRTVMATTPYGDGLPFGMWWADR